MKIELNKNSFPILGGLIEEIAVYALEEFIRVTSVEEFKRLKEEREKKEGR